MEMYLFDEDRFRPLPRMSTPDTSMILLEYSEGIGMIGGGGDVADVWRRLLDDEVPLVKSFCACSLKMTPFMYGENCLNTGSEGNLTDGGGDGGGGSGGGRGTGGRERGGGEGGGIDGSGGGDISTSTGM